MEIFGAARLETYVLVSILTGIFCQDYNDVLNVTNTLLDGYSRYIIPKRNQSEKIKIEMDITLKALNRFNVVDGQITMVIAMDLMWEDEMLSWDPQSNKNIHGLSFPLSRIWSPNLYLLNCAEKFLINKGDPETKDVQISSSGQARLFFMEVLTTTCTSDITFYPNDIHRCKIYLSTLMSASKLQMGLAEIDTANFESNGEWILSNINSEVEFIPTKNVERVVIIFDLERRMVFHMISVVLPVVFLGLVNAIVFKLPVESGERMSFAMTVLLSFAVYMTLITDRMPQTSNTSSIFCMYLMFMLIYSTLITVATVYSINSHHARKNPDMKYFKKIMKGWANIWKIKHREISAAEMKLPPNDIKQENNTKSQSSQSSSKTEELPTKSIDGVFFVFFVSYFCVATLLLFVKVLYRQQ